MAVIAYMIGEHRVLIDEEFLPLMREHRWHINTKGYVSCNPTKKNGNTKRLRLHRVILNAQEGQSVDHINNDPLDNRLKNLRICSHLENMRNRPTKSTRSKFKGLHFSRHKNSSRVYVYIKLENKQVFIGSYDSEEEAARAYDEAAKRHFGEFARLNFPEKEEEIVISATHYPVDPKSLTSSKYRGVMLDKRGNNFPWSASIWFNKTRISLKFHATEKEAARAHDKKSWELFKDPSRLNFSEEYLNDDSL